MIKNISIIILLLISTILTGCKQTSKNLINSEIDKNRKVSQSQDINDVKLTLGDNNEVVLKQGEINLDGVINYADKSDNIYFSMLDGTYNNDKYPKSIYKTNLFNLNNKKLITSVVSNDNALTQVISNGEWIFWLEDEDKIITEGSRSKNWAIYGLNLENNNRILIDKYKPIDIKAKIMNMYAPADIYADKNRLVYAGIDKVENKVYRVLKCYDIKSNKLEIIDKFDDIDVKFYANPSISENNLVWSQSKIDFPSYKEFGSTYLFDIKSKAKYLISNKNNFLQAIVRDSYIFTKYKPNGENENSKIAMYDINTKSWSYIVSKNSSMYLNQNLSEIYNPIFSKNYLTWSDDLQKNVYIVNVKERMFYKINALEKSDRVSDIRLYNKILFWTENSNDKVTHKYAILK